MPPKAIIFDLFGVLGSLFNQRWLRENVADRPEVIGELTTIMHGLDLGRNTQADYFAVAAEAVRKPLQFIQKAMESDFYIHQGMFDHIKELRKKHTVALCSNASAPYARALFKRKGVELEQHFDKVFISSEILLAKPDPAMFKYCASQLGVTPEECAFIDDAELNIEAAHGVGMRTHLFTDQKSFEHWVKNNFN